jgi:hypothetical protein
MVYKLKDLEKELRQNKADTVRVLVDGVKRDIEYVYTEDYSCGKTVSTIKVKDLND